MHKIKLSTVETKNAAEMDNFGLDVVIGKSIYAVHKGKLLVGSEGYSHSSRITNKNIKLCGKLPSQIQKEDKPVETVKQASHIEIPQKKLENSKDISSFFAKKTVEKEKVSVKETKEKETAIVMDTEQKNDINQKTLTMEKPSKKSTKTKKEKQHSEAEKEKNISTKAFLGKVLSTEMPVFSDSEDEPPKKQETEIAVKESKSNPKTEESSGVKRRRHVTKAVEKTFFKDGYLHTETVNEVVSETDSEPEPPKRKVEQSSEESGKKKEPKKEEKKSAGPKVQGTLLNFFKKAQ